VQNKILHLKLLAVISLVSICLTVANTGYAQASCRPGEYFSSRYQSCIPIPSCPEGEFYDELMERCRIVSHPCPVGMIDINANGRDDGDCENLDVIPAPAGCMLSSLGQLPADGHVDCLLPWPRIAGRRPILQGAVGCVDVTRTPYPRAMVRVPVDFLVDQVSGGILPRIENIPSGAPGFYRLSTIEKWTVEGLRLQEVYGHATQNGSAFNTVALLPGDPHPYPSLNNVHAYLKFKMLADNRYLRWQDGYSSISYPGGLGMPAEMFYPFSSFRLPDRTSLYSLFGPDVNNRNVLPAFKVTLTTVWTLSLVAEWDNFEVQNNRYVPGAHRVYQMPLGIYLSQRAWDSRQPLQGTGSAYCNAASGYIPLPVIEAQSVLTQ